MLNVEDRVAFITGGSSGIGLGIARAFVDAGMKVVITYRTPAHLEEARQVLQHVGKRMHAISVDVTDRSALEAAAVEALQVFGRIHVLVNNAGVSVPATLADTTYDDWDWVLGVNVTGVFNGIHIFLPLIREHGEAGHILTTASVLGLYAGAPVGSYCAAKFAVVGMMESLRSELRDTPIGVSVFCPGMVMSNGMDSERNRPTNLPQICRRPDPDRRAAARRDRSDPDLAMDPLLAGRLVLRGIRNNDLYILSHPEYAPDIQDRADALRAAMLVDYPPTAARLERLSKARAHSIYLADLQRRAESAAAACIAADKP